MSEFFAFEHLTWPETTRLRRDTPLVLPLGYGYDLERLSESLEGPEKIGLLPAFPYGWIGSGLPVNAGVMSAYVGNLLDSLRDDGFSRVYCLAPAGVRLGLGAAEIHQPLLESGTPTWSWAAEMDRSKVVIIPVGHTEQHGHHLPLCVDTVIIEAIARRAVDAAPDQAVSLPVMPYGVSTHRSDFPGTMNAGGRAFEDFYLELIDVLVHQGFDRFYFMSGHGGNSSFLVNVVKYAGDRHKNIFCATAWLYLSGPDGVASLQNHRRSPPGGMGHACELETALMLHLLPELVHMERVVDETEFIATPSYYMDWIEGGALIANPPWTDDTRTGAYGAGSLATAEHGSIWLEAAIQEKVSHIAEIHEQQERRQRARRVRREESRTNQAFR